MFGGGPRGHGRPRCMVACRLLLGSEVCSGGQRWHLEVADRGVRCGTEMIEGQPVTWKFLMYVWGGKARVRGAVEV